GASAKPTASSRLPYDCSRGADPLVRGRRPRRPGRRTGKRVQGDPRGPGGPPHMTIELALPRGGAVAFGPGCPLALIAGPCVIESAAHVHFLAREIGAIAGAFVFKASFDKANRSSLSSWRGPGPEEGLR